MLDVTEKFAMARRPRQHSGRVRYPEFPGSTLSEMLKLCPWRCYRDASLLFVFVDDFELSIDYVAVAAFACALLGSLDVRPAHPPPEESGHLAHRDRLALKLVCKARR